MTKTPMDTMLNMVEWEEICQPEDVMNNDEIPWATHSGVLRVGDLELRCYQLSDGRRILNAEDVEAFFSCI